MSRILPPRSRVADEKYMGIWDLTPEAIKREMVRMEQETMRGIAICKDRWMKRGKYDLQGFYGLELLDEAIYELEHVPRKAEDLKDAQAKAAELRAKLADDEQFIAEGMRQNEELEPFAQEFAKEGKTLAQKIGEYVKLEDELRTDLLGGIFAVCEFAGADPIQTLQSIAQRRHQEVTH